MGIQRIKQHFEEAGEVLTAFLDNDSNLEAIEAAGDAMVASLKSGGKVIACGNGGSMTDAMHFAEEMTGRFRGDRKALAALAISDPAHLTCTANDFGFEHVFSRFVEAHGNEGDVLLAISTSGNSANVVNAAKAARRLGMKVVALSGRDGGALAAESDIEIRAPHAEFSDFPQEIHIKVIHVLVEHVESNAL